MWVFVVIVHEYTDGLAAVDGRDLSATVALVAKLVRIEAIAIPCLN